MWPSAQPGDKRRAHNSAADSGALANQQHAASAMSDIIDTVASAPSSSLLSPAPASSAAATSAPAAAAAASSIGARKRQKQTTDAASAVGFAAALPAAPPSRWCGLYSDALHSILQFASLEELSRVLAVSRRWSEAVTTMPPIHAPSRMGRTFDRLWSDFCSNRRLQPTDFPAVLSPLARHVSSLTTFIFPVDCLNIVAQRMPWMRSLSIGLYMQPNEDPQRMADALGRFTSLTTLEVHLAERTDVWNAAALNLLIRVMSGLSMLQSVSLHVPPKVFPLLSFAPLGTLQALHAFSVIFDSGNDETPSCSDSQVAAFRGMRSLTSFDVDPTGDDFLVRMLQPGHAFHWAKLPGWPNVTASLAPLLGSMPTLTELYVTMLCSDVSFLSQLPQLTNVSLHSEPMAPVDPDEFVRALSHCGQMRWLYLVRLQLSGDHFAKLLPCFPKLATLSLKECTAVSSLRCLDTPALAASLTSLTLVTLPRCPSSEVLHLLNLRSLDSLSITRLASPVSTELHAQLTSWARFPHLRQTFIR